MSMAAAYTPIRRAIWADKDWRSLSMMSQWLYLAIISQPDISACGVVPMQERRWAGYNADVDRDGIDLALTELADKRFIAFDNDTAEVWVRSFVKHDSRVHTKSLTGIKAVENSIELIMSPDLRDRAAIEFRRVRNLTNPNDTSGSSNELVSDPVSTSVSTCYSNSSSSINQETGNSSSCTDLQGFPPGTPPVAAAAIELFAQKRVLDGGIGNVVGFKKHIRQSMNGQGAQIMKFLDDNPEATPNDVCYDVFGMGVGDLFVAFQALRNQGVELPVTVTP